MKELFTIGYLSMAVLLPVFARSQEHATIPPPYRATPAHMWEFGLHTGTAMSFGDIALTPNWGTGFHLRKAIDYVFSVRGEAFYGKLKQGDNFNGTSSSTVQSGSLQIVVSINNMVWNNLQRRKTNLYAFLGGGATRFEVRAIAIVSPYLASVNPKLQTHADGGLGIAFRLSDRFNLALESKVLAIFGHDADLLDGVSRNERDVMGYGNIRLNFNIGNSNTRSEPLYWVNPMGIIMQDISELKNRPAFDLTDSDADGVIDMLDQDNTTPPGVVVDTRGLPLDSDGDGTPNFQDDEPYLPKSSMQPSHWDSETPATNEEYLRKIVDDELENIIGGGKNENNQNGTRRKKNNLNGGITEWFLPIVHFNIDNYKIRYADYGNLASIARVMKSNPDLQLVVTGFTDKTASDQYNLDLSYRRAKEVIEHLVNIHGIPRSRFLLNYNGEDSPLVPSTDGTLMNRRVEFRAANDDDVEMENPVPITKKSGKKNGF